MSGKPGIRILAAGKEAVPAFARLHAAAFDEPWDERALSDLLAMPGAFALGAFAEGRDFALETSHLALETHGFVLARLAADEAEILTIAVAPAHRGQGLGHRLMEAAAASVLASGGRALFLEVAADNAPALALYGKLGFRTVGLRPGYYARADIRVDARILRLDLAPEAKKPGA